MLHLIHTITPLRKNQQPMNKGSNTHREEELSPLKWRQMTKKEEMKKLF